MPMNTGMFRQSVGDEHTHTVTFHHLNCRTGTLAVIPPEMGLESRGHFPHHRLSDQQGLGHCSHDAQSGSATVAQPADAWHGRPHHAQAGVTTAQPASAWVTVRHCVPCTAFQAAQTNRLCRCAQTSDIIPSCNRHHTQLVGRPNSCGFTAALSPQAAPTWRPSRRRGVAQSTPASGWANMTEQPGVGRAAACATSVGQDMRSMHPMPCVGPEAAQTNRAAC